MRGRRVPMNLENLREKLEEEELNETKIPEDWMVEKPLGAETLASPRRRRRRRREYELSPVLIVPEGTITIEAEAYRNRVEIEVVELPTTLKSIGKDAFEGCVNLREIEFPEGLKLIGDGAFSRCESLTRVVIPGSVDRVGAFAFCHCDGLESLKIRSGVRVLGRWAFAECVSLKNFRKWDLPRSVEKRLLLTDCRVVDTWKEAFHGSPCALTLEDKRRYRAAAKWNRRLKMMRRMV